MRRTAAVTAILAALTLLPAVSASTAARSAWRSPRTAAAAVPVAEALPAVQGVLDARAEAVAAGDRDAFLATVDPAAPPAFRDAQRRSFDGLRSVPVTGYRLEARVEDSGDLSTGLSPRYGGAPVFLPETRQTYRLAAYDDRDAVDTLWLSFVRREGRWYVGGDADVADLGLDTARNLWDLGPVLTIATEHFLVVARPDKADRARQLADLAEEAWRSFGRAWDQPWSGRIPMVVPSSVDELEVLLQSTLDLDKFVAFVVYGGIRDDGYRPAAPRLFVQDRNLARASRVFQVETLVHELVHAAAAPHAGPAVPVWLQEGVADWVATGRPARERRPRGADTAAPRDFEFSSGSRESIGRAYAEARTLVGALARRHGRDAPARLLREVGARGVAPGSPDHQVDAALRHAFGAGTADLEQAWATGR